MHFVGIWTFLKKIIFLKFYFEIYGNSAEFQTISSNSDFSPIFKIFAHLSHCASI